jgi:glycerate 2-kinase
MSTSFLIAPNAFKGTVESYRAAEIIADVLSQNNYLQHTQCPIADGGDGTSFLLGEILRIPKITTQTFDALGRKKEGYFYLDKTTGTAFIDVSSATGIKHLSKNEINARKTSTYGTGILIKNAVQEGATHIILGLGGSATVDMGLGILQALGFSYYDANEQLIAPFSENLIFNIAHIKPPQTSVNFTITCLCDVKNTFFGSEGAIPVFGPQKGIKKEEIPEFETAAEKVFQILRTLNPALKDQNGFGAAGGIALGLHALLNANLVNGFDYFAHAVQLEEKIKNCDIVITGEGRYDTQSEEGKGSYALLQLAKKYNKKCVLITSGNPGNDTGFDHVIVLPNLDFNLPDYRQIAEKNLKISFENWVKSI